MSAAFAPGACLFFDARRLPGEALLFEAPSDMIIARNASGVAAALQRAETALAAGRYLAGGLAYELGAALEPKLKAIMRASPDPLIMLGVYGPPRVVQGEALDRLFQSWTQGLQCELGAVKPLLARDAFRRGFAEIHQALCDGDIYQANYTFPLRVDFTGDPLALAGHWRARARAGHGALLNLAQRRIFSFSPELFFACDAKGVITARPMKGTRPRGPAAREDEAAKAALRADEKQRAENLMIVDLLRNDLARIAESGSVHVPALFTCETYPTLHTLTSAITAELRPGTRFGDIVRALFPCGSVTGAPKIRAMEIIHQAEPQPRGLYCGALGWAAPDGSASFNVAIRTLIAEEGAQHLRLNAGAGIVYDSRADDEYDECLLKARFAAAREPFHILETMRWERGAGFFQLDLHLGRMAIAAGYFAYPFDRAAAEAALDAAALTFDAPAQRVRLLLSGNGPLRVEAQKLEGAYQALWPVPPQPVLRLARARTRLSLSDPFVRHKTTERAVYDIGLAAARATGAADEVIFLNEAGRVADGSFTCLFALRDGVLLTPPPHEGALDSVLKQALALRAAPPVIETPLTFDDVRTAEAVFAGNSVRGLLRAALTDIEL